MVGRTPLNEQQMRHCRRDHSSVRTPFVPNKPFIAFENSIVTPIKGFKFPMRRMMCYHKLPSAPLKPRSPSKKFIKPGNNEAYFTLIPLKNENGKGCIRLNSKLNSKTGLKKLPNSNIEHYSHLLSCWKNKKKTSFNKTFKNDFNKTMRQESELLNCKGNSLLLNATMTLNEANNKSKKYNPFYNTRIRIRQNQNYKI